LPAIFFAGLLAGVLDITAAFITWAPQGVSPERILQGIASGLLGSQAFKEGMASTMLGGAIHFLIAFSAAAVFLRGEPENRFYDPFSPACSTAFASIS
jgi:hypothetical protein